MPARKVKTMENNHREHRSKRGRNPSLFNASKKNIKLNFIRHKERKKSEEETTREILGFQRLSGL